MGQGQGIRVETDDGTTKTIIFGWGAVALGIGIAVAAVVMAAWLGWALVCVGVGTGIALIAVGIGEGIKRARQGQATIEQAQRGRLPPGERHTLDPPEYQRRIDCEH